MNCSIVVLTLSVLLALFLTECNAKDYCVIGAGPSGLQMGYFLERAGRDYVIYERDPSAGWFYKIYPRHRTLISINKRYTGRTNKEFNMRHDWNSLISDDDELLITKYTKDFFPKADLMVQYLNDFATKLKLKVQYNTNIKGISYNTDKSKYKLRDQNGTNYDCKVLIMSTGMWVENIPRGVDGIEHTEGYPRMSVNPDDYEGENVLIVGRGNSGFETAQNLLQATNLMHMMSRGRVRFAWETHYVGDLRAVNDGPIDTYMLKSLDGQFETDIAYLKFVKKDDGKTYVYHKDSDEADNLATRQGYHHILRCTGFKFDRSIFDKDIRPNRSPIGKKYPEINHGYESVTSKHMFFTGVTTHSLDWRKSAGGFIHGYRYTTRTLHRYLEWRYEGVKWPSTRLPVKDLLDFITKRLNEASGIYQMLSALVDVIILHDDDGTFEYLEEVGIGMLPDLEEYTGRNFTRGIVLNLEYGKNFSGPGKDTFSENRATGDAQEAHTSNFLHPVLYYYIEKIPPLTEDGFPSRPVRIHHMVEDFLTEWVTPLSHIMPLRWFLEYCTGDDLRNFYADTCFEYAMTGLNVPLGCADYLKAGRALPRTTAVTDV